MGHYADHTTALRQQLALELPSDTLRELHQKRPLAHAGIAALLFAILVASIAGAATLSSLLWLPCAVLAGFCLFNMTVLLHEVVHRAVAKNGSERLHRLLGILYAVPSGISSTQFTRWHLDHHAGLGSDDEDPKRHYLSPKRNVRWLKLLYFTPALFPIYFRAARLEASSYPADVQKRVALERNLTIAFHLTLLAIVVWMFGWVVAAKAYLVPYFFVFPVAFALNRLGQHYDIDPADPGRWSTLVRGNLFWDAAFLFSNYHLEHHYFPGVPFYKLPRLQRLLTPFYQRRNFPVHGYGDLLWSYLILNRKPHTDWDHQDMKSDQSRAGVTG